MAIPQFVMDELTLSLLSVEEDLVTGQCRYEILPSHVSFYGDGVREYLLPQCAVYGSTNLAEVGRGDSIQALLDSKEEECRVLTQEVTALRSLSSDLQNVRDQLSASQTTVAELQAVVEEHRVAREADRRQRLELERSLANTRQAHESSMRESERLRTVNATMQEEIATLRSQLTDARRQLTAWHARPDAQRDWIIEREEIQLTDRLLGAGAWGSVKIGLFRGTEVAVKQIHELILSSHNRRLFCREMAIASRCRHPCLLQFIGATNDDGCPLFVMEMLQTDLRSMLARQALAERECVTIGFDVIRALSYLHLFRPDPIIHRDISSSNVLLYRQSDNWRAKLSDYGAANFMRLSRTYQAGGVLYAAPEAASLEQTPKLDVYSFGILFCEMCTRELPVPEHKNDQVRSVANADHRRLIERCTARNASDRPSSVDVVNVFTPWVRAFRDQASP